MLKKLEPQFNFCLGGIIGSGDQSLSWVHIDDLINAILFLLERPDIQGPVNISAPECLSQKSFAKTLSTTMHRPSLMILPSLIVKALFGQMGEELLLAGQNVYPEKLLDNQFTFKFPNLTSALKHEWGK